jgi:uncharacterized protein VirK/YbjX
MAAKVMAAIPSILLAILMILIGASVSGCGTQQPIVVTKYVLETPPDALLQDCPAVPPPDESLYLDKGFDGKEQMFTDTLSDNYQVITVCNIHKSELRAWKKDQIEIYAAKNKQGAK